MAEWKTDIGLEITEANDLARIYDPDKIEVTCGGYMNDATCRTCRHYHRRRHGECRAGPPTVYASNGPERTAWPKVDETDWCGAWKACTSDSTKSKEGVMSERLVLIQHADGTESLGTAECDPLTSHIDASTVRYTPSYCGWCGAKLAPRGFERYCPHGHRATLRQADPLPQ